VVNAYRMKVNGHVACQQCSVNTTYINSVNTSVSWDIYIGAKHGLWETKVEDTDNWWWKRRQWVICRRLPALTWRNGYQTNLFFICNSCKHICTQDCDSSHAVYMYMLRGRHNSGRGGVLPVVYLLLFYLLLFVTSRTCRGVQGVSICPLRLSRVKAC